VELVDSQTTAKRMHDVSFIARQGGDAQVPSQMYPANSVSVPAISSGFSYARMDLQGRADAVGEAVRLHVSRRHTPPKKVVSGVSRGERVRRLLKTVVCAEHALQVARVRRCVAPHWD
jgi:hypothetical protein